MNPQTYQNLSVQENFVMTETDQKHLKMKNKSYIIPSNQKMPLQFQPIAYNIKLKDRVAKYEFENTDDQNNITCKICSDILVDATSCKKCKAAFCVSCFQDYANQNQNSCPYGCKNGVLGGPFPRKCVKALKCIFDHSRICNVSAYDKVCEFCKKTYKSTLKQEHFDNCEFVLVKCEGIGCNFKASRSEITKHEDTCELICQQCIKCKENVPKIHQKIHDCVDALRARFKKRSAELTGLTKNVESITLDIHKQQCILDKLNQLNNDKMKKIGELERCMQLKRSRPPPKQYNYYDHEKSFSIQSDIISSLKKCSEIVAGQHNDQPNQQINQVNIESDSYKRPQYNNSNCSFKQYNNNYNNNNNSSFNQNFPSQNSWNQHQRSNSAQSFASNFGFSSAGLTDFSQGQGMNRNNYGNNSTRGYPENNNESCRCPIRKTSMPIVGKCHQCNFQLCKICKYVCESCMTYVCQNCQNQCQICFKMLCSRCSCKCKK
ncbi:traf-type zinc finger family protein [Stylonychia lemnae]|uniref:Traf-type zinc finger family protein n=1 Tax=Stylonychia lemnae TaxID=5949 RepID=A0A077ZUR9_STYLE|nr:traf-type zinc finger family protein [Stylonychia lemnae]|eukprot:CDW73655.1 traf-type zinc finger family protein [Stylonychia lemnae]